LNRHDFPFSTHSRVIGRWNYFLLLSKSTLPKSPVGGRSKSFGGGTSRSWIGGKARSVVLVTGAAFEEDAPLEDEVEAGGATPLKSADGASISSFVEPFAETRPVVTGATAGAAGAATAGGGGGALSDEGTEEEFVPVDGTADAGTGGTSSIPFAGLEGAGGGTESKSVGLDGGTVVAESRLGGGGAAPESIPTGGGGMELSSDGTETDAGGAVASGGGGKV
jgi:hypothetical protein